MLILYKLFRNLESFLLVFFRFWFLAPTHFPEVIGPRYDPAYVTLADIEKGLLTFPDFPDLPDHVEIDIKNNTLKSSHS